MPTKIFVAALFVLAIAVACRVDPQIRPQDGRKPLAEIVPPGWPQPVYRFKDNPVSDARFALGRELFYETRLSKDNTISCGSCHQQFAAFAHAGHDVSHGINDQLGNRNAPAIFNLAWHPALMHDGGVNNVEVQAVNPITNPVEMDETLAGVVEKLTTVDKYDSLFRNAFGDNTINSQRMLKALGQFMALVYSVNAKYDRYKRGEAEFTPEEARGYASFLKNCSSCHDEPLFSDFEFRNNGLAENPVLHDQGRYLITLDPADRFRFKTPSLRNIAVTAPYMHDGRYATLQECLDHYTTGIKNHTNLAKELEYGIPLSPGEKNDLIAFLHTLTDFDYLNDPRYSDPNFERP